MPGVIGVFCTFVLADAIVEGSTDYALRVGFLVAGVALVGYLVLARPALVVDDEGVTVANVFRTHRIPFGALVDVRVGGLTSIVATAAKRERTITSWNAPGVKRRFPRSASGNPATRKALRDAQPAYGENETERLIGNRWDAWKRAFHPESGLATMTSMWNRREGLLVLAAVAANIAIRLR